MSLTFCFYRLLVLLIMVIILTYLTYFVQNFLFSFWLFYQSETWSSYLFKGKILTTWNLATCSLGIGLYLSTMVPETRLELVHLAAGDFKSPVSTYFTIRANIEFLIFKEHWVLTFCILLLTCLTHHGCYSNLSYLFCTELF